NPPTSPSTALASAGGIDLAWTNASSTATGFNISRKIDSGAWIPLASPTASSYHDSSPADGAFCDYRITARNAVTESTPAETGQYYYATPTIVTPAEAAPNPATGTTVNLSVIASAPRGESHLTYRWQVTSKPAGAPDPTY